MDGWGLLTFWDYIYFQKVYRQLVVGLVLLYSGMVLSHLYSHLKTPWRTQSL